MPPINWQRLFKPTLFFAGLFVIIALLSFYYYLAKTSKPSPQISSTSTLPGFPPGFKVEDLKQIKVPEKGEKTQEGVTVPLETVSSAPQSSSKIRIFEMKGEKDQLLPQSFIAYQDDILNIKLTAVDKDYDLRIEGYNLEIKAKKGETKTIEFQAVNLGKYNFYCSLCSTKEKPAGSVIIVPK